MEAVHRIIFHNNTIARLVEHKAGAFKIPIFGLPESVPHEQDIQTQTAEDGVYLYGRAMPGAPSWTVKFDYGMPGCKLIVSEWLEKKEKSDNPDVSYPVAIYGTDRAEVVVRGTPVEWTWSRPVVPASILPPRLIRYGFKIEGVIGKRLSELTEQQKAAEKVLEHYLAEMKRQGVALPKTPKDMLVGERRRAYRTMWNWEYAVNSEDLIFDKDPMIWYVTVSPLNKAKTLEAVNIYISNHTPSRARKPGRKRGSNRVVNRRKV